MIAAAGNIINDYFDVRADRINKPDRLIIGKYVKRRYAIVSIGNKSNRIYHCYLS